MQTLTAHLLFGYYWVEVIAMIKGPKKTVNVLMPLDLYETLKELAEKHCRSIPSYIRIVLFEHVRSKK